MLMVKTGHDRSLENLLMLCEACFSIKMQDQVGKLNILSPFSSHLLSHVFAYLYYFKLTMMSQSSVEKTCPKEKKNTHTHANQQDLFLRASKNILSGKILLKEMNMKNDNLDEINSHQDYQTLLNSPLPVHSSCQLNCFKQDQFPPFTLFLSQMSNLGKRVSAPIAQYPRCYCDLKGCCEILKAKLIAS